MRRFAHAYRTPRNLLTCKNRLEQMRRWFNWLTFRGVTQLSQVGDQHCAEHLEHRSYRRDSYGHPIAALSATTRCQVAVAVIEIALYGELFTADRYRPGFKPWAGRNAATVSHNRSQAENKTPPVPAEIFQPMLTAALYFVDVLGPHITAAEQTRLAEIRQANLLPTVRSVDDDRLMAVVRRHVEEKRPFDALPDDHVHRRLRQGWRPDDPLLAVNLNRIAQAAGYRQFYGRWLRTLRSPIEAAAAAVGVHSGWAHDAAMVIRADGAGEVPWTLPLRARGIRDLTNLARTACLLVTAALSGMRSGELMELRRDDHYSTANRGEPVRCRLRSKVIKGQPLGGTHDEWVVTEEVFRAVDLAGELRPDDGPEALLFGRFQLDWLYPKLRRWVNGPEGQRLGLAPIPDGPVTMRMLRRTLAMELAYRPGGLLAAKVHLKHISVATTEGYASRPGGAQAKLLTEIGKEEEERNLTLLAQAYEDYQRGVRPAGPGARDLVDFFDTVDGKLAIRDAGAPKLTSDRAVRNLMMKRAATLHLGAANYCWFSDPSRALCLKLAGTPTADKPLAGMCDSTRCPQATHHPCHRPVWDGQARTLKVLLGGLSRRQKTERDRLEAELTRVETVITDIDAAASTAPAPRQSGS